MDKTYIVFTNFLLPGLCTPFIYPFGSIVLFGFKTCTILYSFKLLQLQNLFSLVSDSKCIHDTEEKQDFTYSEFSNFFLSRKILFKRSFLYLISKKDNFSRFKVLSRIILLENLYCKEGFYRFMFFILK